MSDDPLGQQATDLPATATRTPVPVPEGSIEPHAPLLRQPAEDQKLYKVMKAEHLVASIRDSYLHFNRVDSYRDFDGADLKDGVQLPSDRAANAAVSFEQAPDFTLARYYDQSRARTYACCFTLENSDHIWTSYGGGDHGRVAVVFKFGWLRQHLNAQLAPGASRLMYGDKQLRQFFSINYGLVDYVDHEQYRLNTVQFPNPILYSYLKDKGFEAEQELRVTLSAVGIGQLAIDGRIFEFDPSLHMGFDFRKAMAERGITSLEIGPGSDRAWIEAELANLGVHPAP